jgi:hypothetical protein
MLLSLSLLLLVLFVYSAEGVDVTISNVIPRRDTDGAILDAHDSKLNYFEGLYYWHAASYGNCTEPKGNSGCAPASVGSCGFQTDHNVTLYTSPDLVTWTNAGVAFSAMGNLPPQSVLFAPKTVYNAGTKQWVMFYNYITRSFSNSFYGVATSADPAGPFVMVNTNLALQFQDNGDEGIFVDDDGTAYIIYTTLSHGHSMSIERLSPNYTTSLGAAASSGIFGDSFVEAPAMFKRNGIYYATFGSCCCYCESGSEVRVYTSTNPLGNYTKQNVLGAAVVVPTQNGTINAVLDVEYGKNCKNTTVNLTAAAEAACTGSANCSWTVCLGSGDGCIPDPDYGCAKDLSVSWTCSGDPVGAPPRSTYVPGEASGIWAGISCFNYPPKFIPFGSQQTDVFWYLDSKGDKQFAYVGDHWQSAPDRLKSHDFTVWAPLIFDATGNVSSPGFLSSFTIDVGQ